MKFLHEPAMYKPPLLAALLGSAILFIGTVHAGGSGSAQPPWIDSTQVNGNLSLLTIRGRGFGRPAPGVFLGKLPLKIRENSDSEIVAELPDSVEAASYRLVVVTGLPMRISSAPFFTTISANME
ncbi:MAG TPA: IPT/TIG domain-containing protein [Thiobacillus sp.]|nr:MAG: hypothetical protein B7Y21_06670 [Hydrogenophilales bacterium 16-61-112]OZA49882.1 MAG: hypothetical protein B7X81_02240 [Hydrogenophilales bacterium 17-61-76]HQT30927.1 IPT/TIG domain-containing protein [Thiobacillus sp.]HQT70097.1 IPT/TIG domain-containing protein [Thiobacillus sp.]